MNVPEIVETAIHISRNFKFCFARNANLAAHQPINLRVQYRWAGLHPVIKMKVERKQYFVLVTEVHQRPERQSFRRGKLHGHG